MFNTYIKQPRVKYVDHVQGGREGICCQIFGLIDCTEYVVQNKKGHNDCTLQLSHCTSVVFGPQKNPTNGEAGCLTTTQTLGNLKLALTPTKVILVRVSMSLELPWVQVTGRQPASSLVGFLLISPRFAPNIYRNFTLNNSNS